MTKPALPGPPPTADQLHEAALDHLARYATTRAGLTRVLDRACLRWARRAGTEEAAAALPALRQTVRDLVARLAASGIVDDATFAASRAASLGRAGRSRRAIAAHLAARGVAGDDAKAALPDDPETELAAALGTRRPPPHWPLPHQPRRPAARTRAPRPRRLLARHRRTNPCHRPRHRGRRPRTTQTPLRTQGLCPWTPPSPSQVFARCGPRPLEPTTLKPYAKRDT